MESLATSAHLVVLLQLGQHDDDAAPLLPHHVPEVPRRVQHRPLGGDEGPRAPFKALGVKEEGRSSHVLTKKCERVRACAIREAGNRGSGGLRVKDVLLPPSLPVVVLVVRLLC